MRNHDLRAIFEAIKTSGYKLPAEIQKHNDDADKIHQAVLEVRATSTNYQALAASWATSILEDRDPIEDPDILRVLIANVLNQGDIDSAASTAHENKLIHLLPKYHNGILAAFKAAADEAGATLTEAHKIIGTADINDLSRIAGMGAVAVDARDNMIESNRILRVIDQGWIAMQRLARVLPDIPWRLRMGDMDLNTYEKTTYARKPSDLIVKGVTINLAANAETIKDRLEQEREERENMQREIDDRARGKYSVVSRG
ncbi:hypothetical protein [Microbacterium testaceum]|uniref:hypothetical protein n=1 Tax=Microbacterium testaceum TaxID=2033 RepID=UPI001D17694D|nr:hypothetical protein [Microbacterium testaceum]MCC4247486.1 hypothetical protein [Microbacterium testaceum]